MKYLYTFTFLYKGDNLCLLKLHSSTRSCTGQDIINSAIFFTCLFVLLVIADYGTKCEGKEV